MRGRSVAPWVRIEGLELFNMMLSPLDCDVCENPIPR